MENHWELCCYIQSYLIRNLRYGTLSRISELYSEVTLIHVIQYVYII